MSRHSNNACRVTLEQPNRCRVERRSQNVTSLIRHAVIPACISFLHPQFDNTDALEGDEKDTGVAYRGTSSTCAHRFPLYLLVRLMSVPGRILTPIRGKAATDQKSDKLCIEQCTSIGDGFPSATVSGICGGFVLNGFALRCRLNCDSCRRKRR